MNKHQNPMAVFIFIVSLPKFIFPDSESKLEQKKAKHIYITFLSSFIFSSIYRNVYLIRMRYEQANLKICPSSDKHFFFQKYVKNN